MTADAGYCEVADSQLDALEAGSDPALCNAVLDACELILGHPSKAQALSSALTTETGVILRLAVVGHPPVKVFWSTQGPRIEAVLPHP